MIGGELVREARKRADLTQQQLADRSGTTQSAIARLESGRTSPSLEQVERLLRLCGYQLIIELAPYDDSDIVQAERGVAASADERLRRLTGSVGRMRALRNEAQRAS